MEGSNRAATALDVLTALMDAGFVTLDRGNGYQAKESLVLSPVARAAMEQPDAERTLCLRNVLIPGLATSLPLPAAKPAAA